jgi:erythromycin esterase-like protein
VFAIAIMFGCASLLLLAVDGAPAPFLNLDFELALRSFPFAWTLNGIGFEFAIDTSVFQSGTQSLRIRSSTAGSTALGIGLQQFPVELVRGKRVHISGWIKTADVSGAGTLWWRVDGPNGTLSLDNAPPPGPPAGTKDWTKYEFDRDVSPSAVAVVWGVFLRGPGTAWFDDIQITIDGVPLVEAPPPTIGEPTQDELAWIRGSAIPISGAFPGQGYADLMPLKNLIGNARIVALGEATHGTSEFFRMKHRILEFLASEMGFTIFSIEANMPEAYRVNDYVLTGLGDAKSLLKGMYFWTWNTQEVLDMIYWMRDFNSLSEEAHVEFTGFDMQFTPVAIKIVRDFATANDPDALPAITRATTLTNSLMAPGGANFGVATGTFPLQDARGKNVRYSGYIKTSGVTQGYAGLWWRVDGRSGVLAFDNMQNRGINGTRDWTRYEINLPVASDATNINFGALHAGDGSVWFDGLTVELDGQPYSNASRFDFDFESPTPLGFSTGGNGYQVRLDNQTAYSGRQSLRMQYTGALNVGNAVSAAAAWKTVIDRFESSRSQYAGKGISGHDIEWAIQNARVARQAMQMQANQVSRDASMAANVAWILQQSPDAKVVLWAHNGHINRQPGTMGSFLAGWYGKDYLPIEFAFHEGRYNAVNSGALRANDAAVSFPGSAEYIFHRSGMPQFILDLRRALPSYPASAWLFGTTQFRNIGAVAIDGFSQRNNMTNYSDAVIFFDHSTPSALLPF